MDATDLEAGADANREYKDSVFTLLFGDPDKAAEIHYAITGETHPTDTNVKITTLKNVLSNGLINDVSFVLDDKLLVLIEHQSTINGSISIRMLFYIAEIYNRLSEDDNLYSRKPLQIPRPEFIVLYNGVENIPDVEKYKLSDLFKKNGQTYELSLELIVTVYNINKGHNPEMARRSHTLDGYQIFIWEVRENQKTMSLEDAIRKAVADCIKRHILEDFLNKHKREVVPMLLHEWKLEEALEVVKREAWEDGREEGMEKGMEKGMELGGKERAIAIARYFKAKGMSVEEIAKATGLAEDEVREL